MALNVTTLETNLNTKLDNTTSSTDSKEFLLLTKAIEALGTGAVVNVATSGDLPTASDNVGRIMYVVADNSLYYAQSGGTWAALNSTDLSAYVGNVNITGNTDITGTLDVSGDVTITSATDITGATTITGSVGITGDTDITGELVVDSYNETYAAVTSSSNATAVDCEAGNAFMHTLTENTTFTFSNPPASGTAYSMSVEIIQDASASGYTVTWPTSVDWPGGTAPTLTATASAVDVFVFTTRDGGTTWYGFTAGQAIA